MKRHLSPVMFSVTYCVAYIVVLSQDLPLFRYYPQTGQFSWGWQGLQAVGPAMAWYGLMAYAAIAGLLAGLLDRNEKLAGWLRNRLWLFALAAMLGCLYLMKHFFFR
jgi:hypothetical protein